MSTMERTKSELEAMLDGGHSLSDLLILIADVCRDKAEHVRTNWQDEGTAKAWDKAASRIHGAALTRAVSAVPHAKGGAF